MSVPPVFLLSFSALCAACGAVAPTASRAGGEDPFEADRRRELERAGREWIALGLAIVDRAGEEDGVDDALALSIDSGYDLARGELRPALELGGTWSGHDVETPLGEADVDLFRISFGARLTYEREGAPLVPYVRGGAFYRWSNDDGGELEVPDLDGRGHYVGAGLDFVIEPGMSFGPAFTWYQGAEDGLEETFFGLGARFRF